MTVLITGANRGIGAALRQAYLAADERVLGTHRRKEEDGLLELDVVQPDCFDRLSKRLDGEGIDLLICNSGVFLDRGMGPDTPFDPSTWADTFAVNVSGVFATIQTLLPNVRAAKGRIAIISSQMASQTKATGGSYVYRASKAAVLNLGRNLATDLKQEGIPVGIYHPGWVQSDMGGPTADISEADSAKGLVERFKALNIETTGCFETWDGRAHPY